MQQSTSPRKGKEISLDRDIDRLRQQLASLKTFFMGGPTPSSIEEFDLATEEMITEVLGSASPMLEAYQYAQLGEAGGLVNLTVEAPEGASLDTGRENLRQRQRVLESCVGELESRRAEATKGGRPQKVSGPRVAEYMSRTIRAIPMDGTLKEAGSLFQKWGIGSLLVQSGNEFLGNITETELAREVVANGVDAETTRVKTCMREPILTIESSAAMVEAVSMMKDKGTRYVAVTESGKIVGVVSVSDIIRYYSGVK